MLFDGMNGVTGVYAQRIFEQLLGAPAGSVMHAVPLEDFGGRHPDPNQVHAADLLALMSASGAPQLGAACDGDGDRNMILGPNLFVTPGDSLAIIAEHARECIPAFSRGIAGVARSMPTSTAVDRVARMLGVPCYETPTGWKFFGSLMDAGLCTICGEESFGTGADHIREKDGVWAVLAWLAILAHTGLSVAQIVRAHWQRFGRSYYQRHDFEGLDSAAAQGMVDDMRGRLAGLTGLALAGATVEQADDFSYTDPVDGSSSTGQGVRILLGDGSRIVCRLSGTGTEGATLRLYLERYSSEIEHPVEQVLAPLLEAALKLLQMRERCGRDRATVVT
jgi:phosphoglucomutase